MKKVMLIVLSVMCLVGVAVVFAAPSTVTSHSTPELVSQINTILDNPTHAKITFNSSNVVVYATNIADRAALVTNGQTTNAPVGSVVISSKTGKIYIRTAYATPGLTNHWSTFTVDNVE